MVMLSVEAAKAFYNVMITIYSGFVFYLYSLLQEYN